MNIEEFNTRANALAAISAVIGPITASLEELDQIYWELSSAIDEMDEDSDETRGNIFLMEKIASISKNLTIAGRGLAMGIKQVRDEWDVIEH
ncbi:MAG: hypothetical protein AB2697_21805 [Candidatus Thiodiazotropha endolucinida]|nr:hypothetical protein [Candidatus Thiodiazotropha endolucinida]